MAKTKIVVLQMKEIIYTAIFVGLGILLILLLIFMFLPSSEEESVPTTGQYNPGVYTSEIQLGESTLNLEIVVDENQIKSVDFVNLETSVTTMYPLIEPSLENLESQLIEGTDFDEVTLTEKGKYTQTLILDAIRNTLSHASSSQTPAA